MEVVYTVTIFKEGRKKIKSHLIYIKIKKKDAGMKTFAYVFYVKCTSKLWGWVQRTSVGESED